MDKLKSSPKTQMQEEWENNPQDLESAIVYLKEAASSSEQEIALEDVWRSFSDKKSLQAALLNNPEGIMSLLPRLQYLAWKENPGDTANGLDVIRGFLILGKQQEAEESLDDLFGAANSPMELLKNMSKDSSFDAIKTLCQQKAVQYKALNTLRGKREILEYDITEDSVYYGKKRILCGGEKFFQLIGGGYGIVGSNLYFCGENTGILAYSNMQKITFSEDGVLYVGEKKIVEGEIVQIGDDLGEGYSLAHLNQAEKKYIHYKGKHLSNSEIFTFEILGKGFSRDSKYIYFEDKRLSEAVFINKSVEWEYLVSKLQKLDSLEQLFSQHNTNYTKGFLGGVVFSAIMSRNEIDLLCKHVTHFDLKDEKNELWKQCFEKADESQKKKLIKAKVVKNENV